MSRTQPKVRRLSVLGLVLELEETAVVLMPRTEGWVQLQPTLRYQMSYEHSLPFQTDGLGPLINGTNSHLVPAQTLEFLAMILRWSSERLFLPWKWGFLLVACPSESRKEAGQRWKTACGFIALHLVDCAAGSKERVNMKTWAKWIVVDVSGSPVLAAGFCKSSSRLCQVASLAVY